MITVVTFGTVSEKDVGDLRDIMTMKRSLVEMVVDDHSDLKTVQRVT